MRREHVDGRGAGAGIFSGLLFLALGLFLLAGNMNLFPLRLTLSLWWPVILIVIGLKHLIVFRGSRAWVGSLFWIGSGVLFLSSTLGYLNIGFVRLIWPVMLIWLGVSIFLGDMGSCGKQVHNRSES